ncbi:HAD-IA family hydrolase [uncultured Shewanella sp.]|uniref:HAD-IA family hydrolase n=1 Tax=uncultured Shewanella sp. TaxID=173975 RepID=UPI00262F4A15|nr:HAD-IA family hydrolase [uncultured Shewanella sp.]
MLKTTLILDFDGTIVQSGELIYRCLTQYTGRHDLSWVDLKDLSSDNVIEAFGIKRYELPLFIYRIRKAFKAQLFQQEIVTGLSDILIKMHQEGTQLHIVSSNSQTNIEAFLQDQHLHSIISSVICCHTIFGKAKGIKKCLENIKCDMSNTFYIGDETRDIEAAKQAGIASVAVSWGYNSAHILSQYQPDHLFEHPSELTTLLPKVTP